jgi:peroxiredoxin
MQDFRALPADLPVPEDDGAADHLPGTEVPGARLAATDGSEVDLREAARGTLVLYIYPRTGTPGVPLIEGWNEIPGARGCTPQNCSFRDLHEELLELGTTVYGLSAQPIAEQREFVSREAMPFPLLNDSELTLAELIGLPTFEVPGMRLYKRLTMIARKGRVAEVIYPVFPPGSDAAEVVAMLRVTAGR